MTALRFDYSLLGGSTCTTSLLLLLFTASTARKRHCAGVASPIASCVADCELRHRFEQGAESWESRTSRNSASNRNSPLQCVVCVVTSYTLWILCLFQLQMDNIIQCFKCMPQSYRPTSFRGLKLSWKINVGFIIKQNLIHIIFLTTLLYAPSIHSLSDNN